ncbi:MULTISPECIES: NAD-dependent epimerase/dehydratase family protein [unclassified Streptomyces]|uniref:NAD-dependent epimerase/dehydratase family protein n=1 Tax=Streptomyces TaxID=1883 RepID=UPI0001C1ABBB|nr:MULTISPECIES: NAD-dependent epimerase/dehydratase family protein [unclassified Streptomyces]AEN08440.1 FAD dependent oxidoreductase [Streptomyces sp. SirexAA-E]MYR69373.1 NAD-dependent epimerase/dehydratase family protein [Streptomyces sp. SID4939]MYS02169.1 NAD-dependent epimerase/dehydratase family protein [Streptomyces sp. SID4940]MYT66414.1 NAD-dependent epimerase/dehydratase family protein [Streptomyces sp. SID8357]MYT83335.1 NAD-dependent epimerase/dehydratase family protein [Streptom
MTATSGALHTVLGAGPAGTSVALELARRGHAVRLVDRAGSGEALDGVERLAGDVGTVDGALAAIEGADVVYHCVNVAYHLQVDVMPGIQEAVLGAVARTGARLVVLDTIYPYGETRGEVMTEDTPWRAATAKGKMRAALDENYLAAHKEDRAKVVLGRSADFVGPRVLNSTLGGAVFPGALTGGEVLALGDIDLEHSYSSILDVARGLAVLGENPSGDGRAWHLPTAPARTTREILTTLGDLVGHPLRTVTVDQPRPFGPFDETFMNSYAELFYQHTEPQIMDSSAFQRKFGIAPTPIETTLSQTLEWYRGFLAARAKD